MRSAGATAEPDPDLLQTVEPLPAARTSGRRRRRRTWLAFTLPVLAVVALAAGLVFATLRGRLAVPAGRLERTLSETLGGKVRIGSLRLEDGPRRAVVTGLRIEDVTLVPQLRRLEVDRIELYGRARDLLGGDFERAVVAGARVELEPRCGPPPSWPGAASGELGRQFELRLEPATVRLLGPGAERSLTVEGTVRNTGGGLEGELLLTAPEMELRRLASLWRADVLLACASTKPRAIENGRTADPKLDAALVDARVDLRFKPQDVSPDETPAEPKPYQATIDARARALRLPRLLLDTSADPEGDQSGEVEIGGVAAHAEVAFGPIARVEAELELPDVGPIEITWSSASGELNEAQVSVRAIDLGAWTRSLGPPAWGSVEGKADLDVHSSRREAGAANGLGEVDTWSAALRAVLPRLSVNGVAELRGVELEASASELDLASGTGRLSAKLAASEVRVPAGAATAGTSGEFLAALARAAGPTSATFDGGLRGLRPGSDSERVAPEVEGKVALRSAVLGAVDVDGTLSAAARAAKGRYRWTHGDAAALWSAVRAALPEVASAGTSEAPAGDADGFRRELESWSTTGSWRAAGTLEIEHARALAVRSSGHAVLAGATVRRQRDVEGSIPVRFRPPQLVLDYGLSNGTLRIASRGEGELTMEPLAPRPVSFDARASWRNSELRLERVTLLTSGLGELELDGTASPGAVAGGGLRLRAGEVGAWREWLVPLLPSDALPADELSGGVRAEGRWRREDGEWSFAGATWLEDSGWANTEGTRVVEGLATRIEVAARRGPRGESLALGGELGGFRMLWEELFADFGGRSVTWNVALEGPRLREGPIHATLLFDGDGGVSLRASADRTAERWMWQARGSVGDLATATQRYVTSALALEGTSWEGLEAAGRIDLAATGELGPNTGTVAGELLLLDGAGKLGERASIDGAFAQLPLQLAWQLAEAADDRSPSPDSRDARANVLDRFIFEAIGEPREGRLAFERLRVGETEIGATAVPLEVTGDTVVVEAPVEIPLYDGEVVVSDLVLADALGSERHLEAAVALRGLSLERATAELGMPELRGQVDGQFPRVVVRGAQLTTEGASEVDVFGGRAVLEDVSASALRSPYPHLSFSASFEDVDLEQLTQTLELGRITGRLRGELREVELIGSTPVRLVAEVRTVETAGVPQRVTIEAVNSLTLLGTGADASFLERGLRSFFETYPYEAIGIAVALEGDAFLLRGLERRGDKELFLKGRWPLRLDIVNAVPGTRVSYEAMTSRIGNLQVRRGRDDRDGDDRNVEAEPATEENPP